MLQSSCLSEILVVLRNTILVVVLRNTILVGVACWLPGCRCWKSDMHTLRSTWPNTTPRAQTTFLAGSNEQVVQHNSTHTQTTLLAGSNEHVVQHKTTRTDHLACCGAMSMWFNNNSNNNTVLCDTHTTTNHTQQQSSTCNYLLWSLVALLPCEAVDVLAAAKDAVWHSHTMLAVKTFATCESQGGVTRLPAARPT
jgi:hypothetical protein